MAPAARAQDCPGHYETRIVSETIPGHFVEQPKQVWQPRWIEVREIRHHDGRIERVRIEHPGTWTTVIERVWVEPVTVARERQVWIPDPIVVVEPPCATVVAPAPVVVVERPRVVVETPVHFGVRLGRHFRFGFGF